MGATVGDVLGSLRADSPWLLVAAAALLAAAAAVGKRLAASLQRIGARVGVLEQTADSEQTRRRQVESELLRLGVPLPYWPKDPADARELIVLRRRARERELQDEREDQDDEEPPITRHIPVPPLPPLESAAAARHRR